MPIQIGQRADHGFDQPLGLLSDCHRRIEHFLRVLATTVETIGGRHLTTADRQALEGALTYFAVAAPRHTADEEASLFPRLRRSRDPAVRHALTTLDALERDHEEADAQHAAVDELVRRWLAGTLTDAETARLREYLARLQALYARHIAIEDQQIFPAAARALDRAEIAEIGGEMAARRQVPPIPPDL